MAGCTTIRYTCNLFVLNPYIIKNNILHNNKVLEIILIKFLERRNTVKNN